MKKLFSELKLRELTLKNRVVMPPMCMYMSSGDGMVTDWHIHHYVARAIAEVGLIIIEATGVSPEGRISDADLGIWSDEHISGLRRLTQAVHAVGGKIGIQIAHAGRKAQTISSPHLAPTDTPFSADYAVPRPMDEADIERVVRCFGEAAGRALAAEFDLVEIHGAHGYLISSFLSPLTNTRDDAWGGSSRARFLERVVVSVRKRWPENRPLGLRLSATDHAAGGIEMGEVERNVRLAKSLGVDLINVSSGGVVETPIRAYPGYQVPYATRIRENCGIPVIAGGLIDSPDLADDILENERADLIYIGRALLRSPNWVLEAAARSGQRDTVIPRSYRRGWQ